MLGYIARGEFPYQIIFLKDDRDQSVEVEELDEVDFAEIKRRLQLGQSVFITRKLEPKLRMPMFKHRIRPRSKRSFSPARVRRGSINRPLRVSHV